MLNHVQSCVITGSSHMIEKMEFAKSLGQGLVPLHLYVWVYRRQKDWDICRVPVPRCFQAGYTKISPVHSEGFFPEFRNEPILKNIEVEAPRKSRTTSCLDLKASHHMSEFLIPSPSLSTVAAQFNHLYPQSYNFSHLPVLMTIGKCWKILKPWQ